MEKAAVVRLGLEIVGLGPGVVVSSTAPELPLPFQAPLRR